MLKDQLTTVSYSKFVSKILVLLYRLFDFPSKLRILNLLEKSLGSKRLLANVLGFNMTLDKRDLIQRQLLYDGIYEPEITNILNRIADRNSIFFDIGANVGYYTCLMAQNKVDEIYAFEPDTLSFQILNENLNLNQFESQINLFNVALGEKVENLLFKRTNVANTGISGFLAPVESTTSTYEVLVKRLDDFCDKISGCSHVVIKIDVEGWEKYVILGGHSFFKQNCKYSIILETEVHDSNKIKDSEISNFFMSNGFEINHVKRDDKTNQVFENFLITKN